MSVTVRAKLPKGDRNGLAHLEAELADQPDAYVAVIALVRTDTIEHHPHDDENPTTVKLTIASLEAVDGKASDTVKKLLRDSYASRTGKRTLPFEEDAAAGND